MLVMQAPQRVQHGNDSEHDSALCCRADYADGVANQREGDNDQTEYATDVVLSHENCLSFVNWLTGALYHRLCREC
jgi:hypothetical protein